MDGGGDVPKIAYYQNLSPLIGNPLSISHSKKKYISEFIGLIVKSST